MKGEISTSHDPLHLEWHSVCINNTVQQNQQQHKAIEHNINNTNRLSLLSLQTIAVNTSLSTTIFCHRQNIIILPSAKYNFAIDIFYQYNNFAIDNILSATSALFSLQISNDTFLPSCKYDPV